MATNTASAIQIQALSHHPPRKPSTTPLRIVSPKKIQRSRLAASETSRSSRMRTSLRSSFRWNATVTGWTSSRPSTLAMWMKTIQRYIGDVFYHADQPTGPGPRVPRGWSRISSIERHRTNLARYANQLFPAGPPRYVAMKVSSPATIQTGAWGCAEPNGIISYLVTVGNAARNASSAVPAPVPGCGPGGEGPLPPVFGLPSVQNGGMGAAGFGAGEGP